MWRQEGHGSMLAQVKVSVTPSCDECGIEPTQCRQENCSLRLAWKKVNMKKKLKAKGLGARLKWCLGRTKALHSICSIVQIIVLVIIITIIVTPSFALRLRRWFDLHFAEQEQAQAQEEAEM
jgi:hypothetical protein